MYPFLISTLLYTIYTNIRRQMKKRWSVVSSYLANMFVIEEVE